MSYKQSIYTCKQPLFEIWDVTSIFEKSWNVKQSSESEKQNGYFIPLSSLFRYYVYFPLPMTPGASVGILTLIIISRGPNYEIKSVMKGLAINN